MAAVENLSEVIKDNVKEHVSAAEKETSVENIKLYNGDAESERPQGESNPEANKTDRISTARDCSSCDVVMSDVKNSCQERNSGVSVICKTFKDVADSKPELEKDIRKSIELNSNESKASESSEYNHGTEMRQSPANGTSIGNGKTNVKSEPCDEISNGDVRDSVLVDGRSETEKSRKEEAMDVDLVKKEENVTELNNDKKDLDEFNDEKRGEDKSNDISQDSLFKKLGFNAVQQLTIEKLRQGKDENVDVSNYDENLSNKLVLKAQENVLGKMLEKKSTRSSSGTLVNGVVNEGESYRVKRLCEQRTVIDNLKEDLRTEEAKLLLLRRVFDSQTSRKNGSIPLHKMKENSNRPMNMPSLHPKSRYPGQSYNNSPSDSSSSIQIAPKVIIGPKGSSSGSNLPRIVPSIVPSTASSSNGDSTRVSYHSSGSNTSSYHKYYIQVGNQLVPAAPPTCMNQPVYAMPSYTSATSVTAKATSSVSTTGTVPSSSSKPPLSAESQASKHSAAKAALRRQLEQTLLQIPPPRPPSADWKVIPNVNSMDFMMLVGLDEIVDMILESDGKPTLKSVLTETLPTNPLICDQCGMDFSPNWKHKEDEKAGEVLCEKCSLTSTKKDLKAEHTSRLKSAFLKALKQEQELEEKIKAGEDISIASPPLEKEHPSAAAPVAHHQPMHSTHKTYKHQKGQISSDHRHPVVHHHHHQVVQHYPHHTSLVHQLHQQHMQQQMDYDGPVGGSHRSPRWHPYLPSHHHGSSHVHNLPHHRSYSASSSRNSDSRHEYYVVHHPQHSTSSGRWAR